MHADRNHTFILFLFLAVFLLSCRSHDDRSIQTKAVNLFTEASYCIEREQYPEAEEYLNQCLPLFRQNGQSQHILDAVAALGFVQSSRGKLVSSLETYRSLQALAHQIADQNTEVKSFIALGDVSLSLYDPENSLAQYGEAIQLSTLVQNHSLEALSLHGIGRVYMSTGNFTKAESSLVRSVELFKALQDTLHIAEVYGDLGLTAANKGDRAGLFRYYSRAEEEVSHSSNRMMTAHASYIFGRAFSKIHEWGSAISLYKKALSVVPNDKSSRSLTIELAAKREIGEIYYFNYSFQPAKEFFFAAYTLAKTLGLPTETGYALIRLADCEQKENVLRPSQSSLFRAVQYSEEALSQFTKNGSMLGEALAVHRLARIKDLTNDIDGAVKLYMRAFSLSLGAETAYDAVEMQSRLSVDVRSSIEPEHTATDLSAVIGEPLVSLLIQRQKYDEALWYIEQSRSREVQAELFRYNVSFHTPERERDVQSYVLQMNAVRRQEREVLSLNEVRDEWRDQSYRSSSVSLLREKKKSLAAQQPSIVQKYPSLGIIFSKTPFDLGSVRQSLPAGSTVLDYCEVDGRMFVFAIGKGGVAAAIPLGITAAVLEKKKDRYRELFEKFAQQSPIRKKSDLLEFQSLSRELYDKVIRPVERYGAQRFIIVTPEVLEGLPFHALLKETPGGVKPLIELIDVSYLPLLAMMQGVGDVPKYVGTIVAFGYTSGKQWGLEYELRDIRSFFKNPTVVVAQEATEKKLAQAAGDVLQISANFSHDARGTRYFTLSSGSLSSAGIDMPVSFFTRCASFPIVYLCNQTGTGVDRLSPVMLLMNGSAVVTANLLSTTSKMNQSYAEKFYSVLSKTNNPNEAYRQALILMSKQPEYSDNIGWGAWYKYGK